MPEESLPSEHSKLSPEDLEVLHTFLATDEFETSPPDNDAPGAAQPVSSPHPLLDFEDEMHSIFTSEVHEDLVVLRGGLEQAERDERANSAGFHTLRQVAHKISGTAAAIGCDAMSAIAHHIEIVIQQITAGEITVLSGLYELGHAVGALEMTLESVAKQGQEEGARATARVADGRPGPFDHLIQHSEQLIEQQTALEHARKQVEAAFQELHTAQARLKRIETFFSNMFMSMPTATPVNADAGAASSSSLVARILREAAQRTGHTRQLQAITTSPSPSLEDAARWDELEMDRFSEKNLLAHALNEAIGDTATATAQLQRALARLDILIGQHIVTARQVRAGAMSLRAAPFNTLIQHTRQAALKVAQDTGQMQGLLVRAWEQQVIIPFSQVLRIDYHRQDSHDHLYALNALLGLPTTSTPPITHAASWISPVLRLSTDTGPATRVAVQVDEVIGQVELLIKLPPAPLMRPGVTGMTIDSAGKVLLVLDVHELIRHDGLHQAWALTASAYHETPEDVHTTANTTLKILIVDDSVSIRRTLRQTFSQKDYIILEARDGLEALEIIEEEAPQLLLLDLEMPHMNGYDMLNVLHTRSLLPGLKIVLLTSRTSEKHKQRARELGAHAYLTKPCSENTLLETVASLLADALPE
ncbi:MAG: hypothetical protein NVS3B14_14130 [Ktedonobacteraceae bacterium]